jgi:hypothetical protein
MSRSRIVFAFGLGVLVFLTPACSKSTLDKGKAKANLKAFLPEMRRAFLEFDHGKFVGYTHPALVKQMGGTDAMVNKLKGMADEMSREGFKFDDMIFEEPSDIVESAGGVYSVVPFTLRMTSPTGGKGTSKSALIGMSSDVGVTWTFVDAEGVGGDRKKLKMIMPDFPDGLKFPSKSAPVWD